jgi:hypothetical protein
VAAELRRLHAAGRSIRPIALQLRHPLLWARIKRHFEGYDPMEGRQIGFQLH